jgi:hypothetical protein
MYVQKTFPAISALLLLLTPALAAAEPTRADKIREHFAAAERAARDMRLSEALEHFRQAWKLEKAHDTACNIGRFASRIGDKREAAEFLTRCQDMAPQTTDPAEKVRRADEQIELEAVKKDVGALRLEVSAPGAEVFVDGNPVGVSPLPDKLVFVEPGRRRLRAKRGAETAEVILDVVAGEVRVIPLQLRPAPGPVASPPKNEPAPLKVPPPMAAAQGGLRWELVAIGATGAAISFGAGVANLVASHRAQAEAGDLVEQIKKDSYSLCELRRSELCTTYWRAEADREDSQSKAIGLFITAGAIAAGTLVYMYFAPRQAPRSRTGVDVLSQTVRW